MRDSPRTRAGDATRRRSAVRSLARGGAYGLLLLVLAVAAATIIVPKATGAVPLSVLSNSMAPTMPVGSLAVVRPTMATTTTDELVTMSAQEIETVNDTTTIGIGQVIVYQPNAEDPTMVMHRVTGRSVNSSTGTTFTAQGDNNSIADEPVAAHQVRGVVQYHLPWLGHVNQAVNGNQYSTVIAVAAATALYAWALLLIFRRPASRTAAQSADARRPPAP
jgi:signal peptidase